MVGFSAGAGVKEKIGVLRRRKIDLLGCWTCLTASDPSPPPLSPPPSLLVRQIFFASLDHHLGRGMDGGKRKKKLFFGCPSLSSSPVLEL